MSPYSRPPGRETVYLKTAVSVNDGLGGTEETWPEPNPTRKAVRGCDVQPGSSIEYLLGRDAVTINYFVYAPAGTVVNSYQRVEYRGKDYNVYGNPEDWAEGTGSDYVGIALQKVEG